MPRLDFSLRFEILVQENNVKKWKVIKKVIKFSRS